MANSLSQKARKTGVGSFISDQLALPYKLGG